MSCTDHAEYDANETAFFFVAVGSVVVVIAWSEPSLVDASSRWVFPSTASTASTASGKRGEADPGVDAPSASSAEASESENNDARNAPSPSTESGDPVTRRSSTLASSPAPPASGTVSMGPPITKLVSGLIATGVSTSESVSSAPESTEDASNAAVAGAFATVSFRDDAVSGGKPRAGRAPLCVSRGAEDDGASVSMFVEETNTLASSKSVATEPEGADLRRSLTGASS